MKNKTFYIWIAVILLIFAGLMALTSRGKSEEKPPVEVLKGVNAPFDAKAHIKMQNMDLTADLNRTAENCITVKINEPASIAGMTFTYNGQDIETSFKGLTVTLDENSKLVSSLAEIIVNSLNKASDNEDVDVSITDGVVYLTGKSDSGEFQMRLDKKDGSIASISLPELQFECRFDEFIFKR